MQTIRFRLLGLFLLAALVEGQARPDEDAVAAVLKLRSGYSWETAITQPGTANPPPPRTRSGSITAEGEVVVENTWPDGRVVRAVSRRDGAVVVQAETGWITRSQLAELSRTAKRNGSVTAWARLAVTALEAMTPEEELNRLLNDCTDYTQTGDRIEAVLTERGASFWLGSGRLIRRATGTMQLRLHDGLIRECHISVEGNKAVGPTGDGSAHVEFESTTKFNYSSSLPVPDAAREKLDAQAAR